MVSYPVNKNSTEFIIIKITLEFHYFEQISDTVNSFLMGVSHVRDRYNQRWVTTSNFPPSALQYH